jgi:nicotinate phosphoribosyltransferase
VRRFTSGSEYMADMIYDENQPPAEPFFLVDPMDSTRRRPIRVGTAYEDLLIPVMRRGELVYEAPSPAAVRATAKRQLEGFHPGVRRFLNPHGYPVGLDKNLHDTKTALILAAREEVARAAGKEMR